MSRENQHLKVGLISDDEMMVDDQFEYNTGGTDERWERVKGYSSLTVLRFLQTWMLLRIRRVHAEPGDDAPKQRG